MGSDTKIAVCTLMQQGCQMVHTLQQDKGKLWKSLLIFIQLPNNKTNHLKKIVYHFPDKLCVATERNCSSIYTIRSEKATRIQTIK